MSDEYKLTPHGNFLSNTHVNPETYDVRDADTGEKLGEVNAWNHDGKGAERAGEKIADGDWHPGRGTK